VRADLPLFAGQRAGAEVDDRCFPAPIPTSRLVRSKARISSSPGLSMLTSMRPIPRPPPVSCQLVMVEVTSSTRLLPVGQGFPPRSRMVMDSIAPLDAVAKAARVSWMTSFCSSPSGVAVRLRSPAMATGRPSSVTRTRPRYRSRGAPATLDKNRTRRPQTNSASTPGLGSQATSDGCTVPPVACPSNAASPSSVRGGGAGCTNRVPTASTPPSARAGPILRHRRELLKS
jgi:hypothetical protein